MLLNSLQHTATHCNTLQRTLHTDDDNELMASLMFAVADACTTDHLAQHTDTTHIATHCNILQYTATHYITLQRTLHTGDDNEHMASLMFALQIMLRNQDFQPRESCRTH